MNKRMVYSGWFLSALTLLAVSIAGCGKETINVPDTTPPYVLSTVPGLGAASVALNAPISATFSKAVNCATVNTGTFTVSAAGGAGVAGSVACSGSGATFTPSSPFTVHTLYTAAISTGVTDLSGVAMVQSYVWNFEVVPAPSVVSTTPANGATVGFSPTISATFQQLPAQDPDSAGAALNCSTVTASTFTVTAPAPVGTVAGTVACSGATATFTPTSPATLPADTVYTATLTTGVQNVAGSGLASPFTWTFTTDVQPTVISTLPVNNATGILLGQEIGATFSKPMNCATLYSPATTFLVKGPGGAAVAGTVGCTGNGAIFTPSNLLATNTVYTATITTGATDLLGVPLAGNYVWSFITVPAPTAPTVISTVPANLAAGVATNQAVSATFSEAMNPATINAANFTLTAPGNVAVAGTVGYAVAGSVATFTPTSALTASTTYVATIKTGVQDLAGNALANNYVWTFTTGAAPNTTKPTVIATNPVTGATGVPINQAVSATFSEAMNPLTINGTTFTLTGPGTTAVAGLVTYASVGNTTTFTPTAPLASSTLYTATVTTGVQDLSANAMASNYVWTFTTGSAVVTTGPTIILTSPVNGATAVPYNTTVSATFSKAMNPLSISTSTFTLTGSSGGAVTGTVAYNAVTFIATFTPSANLTVGTYTADVTTGATDLAGNPLGSGIAPNPWSFTTVASPGPPAVVLGTAALFGDFGGTAGMTNQGIETVVNGDTGTTAVSSAVTGFHDTTLAIVGAVWPCTYTETPLNIGQVNGTIYTDPPPPTVNCPNEGTAVTAAIAAQAAADTLTAYNSMTPASIPGGLAVESCPAPGCTGVNGGPGELGNRILQAGVYKSTPGTYQITLGPLTLDAQGNPNATWIFQMASSLTVGGASNGPESVILVNGAQAANVFWQVGSAATINGPGGGTFSGTVIAHSGVTTGTAGITTITTVNGRLLSTIGAVTLVNTVVNVPAP